MGRLTATTQQRPYNAGRFEEGEGNAAYGEGLTIGVQVVAEHLRAALNGIER